MWVLLRAGEGCRMWGHLEVNKVAGNFHFAPGRSYQQGNMHVSCLCPHSSSLSCSHACALLAALPVLFEPLVSRARARRTRHLCTPQRASPSFGPGHAYCRCMTSRPLPTHAWTSRE